MSGFRTVLGVVLAALALYGVQKTTPYYSDITSPIVVSGSLGEVLAARDFEFTAERIMLARQVRIESYGREQSYGTSGLWAVVEATAAARNESVTITASSWLGPNGARYDMSERFSTAPGLLATERLEPGLPRKVLLFFEFPESQASGATLLVSRMPFTPLDSELRIDMPQPPPVRQAVRLAKDKAGWRLEVE